MKKRMGFTIALVLAFAVGCGDDADSGESNNVANNGSNNVNAGNNQQNNVQNNGSDNRAAQQLGTDLFGAVMNLMLTNVLAGATPFEQDGTEGERDCIGAIGVQQYGTMDLDYTDSSTAAAFEATTTLNGCLAMESGSNPALEFVTTNPSGDDLPDIYRVDGTIAAMTFDENGFPPVNAEMFPATPTYDPDAEPTCSNVVLDGVLLEGFAVAPDEEMFTNTEESYTPGGYTAGIITANCGGQTLRCDLNGGAVPLATLSLDAVTASKDAETVCTFVN